MTMTAPVVGMDNTAPSTSGTEYNFLSATQTSSWDTTEVNRAAPVPAATTLSNLNVYVTVAPGASKSYTFTLMVNGSPSALTCTVSGTNTSASDVTHSVTLAAGDLVSLQSTPSASAPTATNTLWWNLTSSGAGQSLLGGGITNPSSSAVNYCNLRAGGTSWRGTDDNYLIMPCAGTISKMYVRVTTAPGSGKSFTFAVMLNGSASALTAQIADANTSNSDLTHSVAVVAGDKLSMRSTPAGTPTAPAQEAWGILFTPTVEGNSFLSFGTANNPSTTLTHFEVPHGVGANSWGTGSHDIIPGAWLIKSMYIDVAAAPGAGGSGRSYTFDVRNTTQSTSGPTVTISETATSGNNATDHTTVQGDKISLRSVPANTPGNTSGVHMGVLIFTSPSSEPVRTMHYLAGS